jgi:hypothetical protein
MEEDGSVLRPENGACVRIGTGQRGEEEDATRVGLEPAAFSREGKMINGPEMRQGEEKRAHTMAEICGRDCQEVKKKGQDRKYT